MTSLSLRLPMKKTRTWTPWVRHLTFVTILAGRKILKKDRCSLPLAVRLELMMGLKTLGFPWDFQAGRRKSLGPGCQTGRTCFPESDLTGFS